MTATAEFRECNTKEIVNQIGMMNIFAISGGRIEHRPTGITLSVSNGHRVTVDLAFDDTYTVRHTYTRKGETIIKGERTNVYFDEVGEVAYKASCYRNNYTPEQW